MSSQPDGWRCWIPLTSHATKSEVRLHSEGSVTRVDSVRQAAMDLLQKAVHLEQGWPPYIPSPHWTVECTKICLSSAAHWADISLALASTEYVAQVVLTDITIFCSLSLFAIILVSRHVKMAFIGGAGDVAIFCVVSRFRATSMLQKAKCNVKNSKPRGELLWCKTDR